MSDEAVPPASTKPVKPRGMLLPVFGAALLSSAMSAGAVLFLVPKPAVTAAAAADEGEGGDEPGDAADEHEAPAKEEGHGGGDGHGKSSAKAGSALYEPLTPAFVVNLNSDDSNHFLQVEMEIRAKNNAAIEAMKQHNPQIRNALLMLLGQQSLLDISTREGKEAVQKKVLEELQRILKQETGKTGIDAVYFTSFVMQ